MRLLVLAVVAVGSVGCLDAISLGRELSAATADAGTPPPTWGRYIEGVSLPDCAWTVPPLWVTTTDDGLDTWPLTTVAEAGPTLSLPEALAIVSSTPGQHHIRFDPSVFPVDAPATITLRAAVDHHFSGTGLQDTCLDGRGSGVVVDWEERGAAPCPQCVFSLGPGSLMVGLTLTRLPNQLTVVGAQVAGCRLESRFMVFELPFTATIGPGNVISGSVGVHALGIAALRRVEDNFFGFDPVSRTALPLEMGVVASQGLFLQRNVLRNTQVGVAADILPSGTNVIAAEANFFGVDRSLAPLPGNSPGVAFQLHSGNHVLGTDNVIWGSAVAVEIVRDAHAIVTMNRIYGNVEGIRYDGAVLVPAPVITSVDPVDGASGTCALPGSLEVYSDLADQGEDFVGYTTCDGAQWRYRGLLPRGRNLTALLVSRSTVIGTSPFSAPVAVGP